MTTKQPRSRSTRRARATDDAGFTVLEVIVSFTLFIAVATGAGYGIVNALQAAHVSQERVDAGNVAQTFIADAQAKAATITSGPATIYAESGSEQFTVVRTITFSNGGSTCFGGQTFTVSVAVNQRQTGKFLARSDSVVSCP